MEQVYNGIEQLLYYGIEAELISQIDKIYFRNRIFNMLKILPRQTDDVEQEQLALEEIFDLIFSAQQKQSLGLEYSFEVDIVRTELINLFAETPQKVITTFEQDYHINPQLATTNFYQYCKKIDYIKDDSMNERWHVTTKYGILDITINLAKPEKDPKEIAALLSFSANVEQKYPVCQLCIDNVGFQGNATHPSRINLRIIPLTLANEQWYFQFSPYGYFDEHAIVLKKEHDDMKMGYETFERLFDFIDQFPHYFIGSNADIPIVGGSILNHEHFQAGKYEFPMMRAEVEVVFERGDITYEILNWPVSVLRLTCENRHSLIETIFTIFEYWKSYTNEKLGIYAKTEMGQHNAITPIIRKKAGNYECYLAFRNNRTSDDYPDGIFHPHQEVHHIKKENIGLIEVMGCAILPSRLKEELADITDVLLGKKESGQNLEKHQSWISDLSEKYDARRMNREEIREILKEEVGHIFKKVLEHTKVFKETADFNDFLNEMEK